MGFMGRVQGIPGVGTDQHSLGDIICEYLLQDNRTAETMKTSLIRAFLDAHSFADATRKMDLL